MDITLILLIVGFIFAGFLIGYPIGNALGRREAALDYAEAAGVLPPRRIARREILDAEYLEVK